MDAINRFLGIQQGIIPEPLETEVPPDQTAQPASSTGIASVPDMFETFQAPAINLTPLTTPLTTPNPPAQGETVDASSIFGLLNPEISEVVNDFITPMDKNKWDVIEFLLNEIRKNPVDASAMLDRLTRITPEMRKDVLSQLSSQGDLSRVMFKMYDSNPSIISSFMVTLIGDSKNDPQVAPLLSEVYKTMSVRMGEAHDTSPLRQFLQYLSSKNELGSTPPQLIAQMESDSLTHGRRMDLTSYSLLREANYIRQGDPSPKQKAHDDVMAKLDSVPVNDPNYEKYMGDYPIWGEQQLVKMLTDPTQFRSRIQRLMQYPDGAGRLLAKVCKDAASLLQNPNGPTQQDLQNVMVQVADAMQQHYDSGSPGAKLDCAHALNGLAFYLGNGQDGVNVLSTLPPNVLMDLAVISNGGINIAVSTQDMINQALAISKLNYP